jgi:putative ABC transport system permease protein
MPRALWAKSPIVLLQHRSVFVAVVCSAALVAMAAAGGPLLRAAVESESLKAKLVELTPLGAGQSIETSPAKGDAQSDTARRAAARRLGLRFPSTRAPVITTSALAQVGGLEGGRPLFVVPMARDGARAHVRVVKGVRRGAFVAETVARLARVAPGDRLQLIGAPDGKHIRSKTIPVGAVYVTLDSDRDNPYWVNFTYRIRTRNPDSDPLPTFLLVDRENLYSIARDVGDGYLANTYEFPVDVREMTPARAERLAASFAATRRLLGHDSPTSVALGCRTTQTARCNVSSSLEAAVDLARRSVDALSPVISLLVGFAGLIAVAAAVVTGAFNVRRRDGEARLSVVQGERRAVFAARAVLEGLIPVALGTVVGLLAAGLMVRSFAPEGTVEGSVVRHALLACLVGGCITLAAVAAGAWAARGPTIERRRSLRHLTVPWEVPALLLAGATYVVIRRGGGLVRNEAIGSHPRLAVLVFPLLLAAAVAGLLSRAARRALRHRQARSNVLFLALRRLASARTLLVLLTVTTAVAFAAVTFAEVLDASLTSNSREKAFVANGSDVQGLIDQQQALPRGFPVPIARVVQSFDSVFVDGSSVEALVVDPSALRRAIRWEWPHDPRPPLAALGASDAPLPVLANSAASHARSIEIGGRRLPIHVVATVDAFPGAVRGEPLLVLPADKLERAERAAGVAGDPLLDATTFVWAKGEPRTVSQLLARSELAPSYITTVDHFLDSAELTTAGRAYGFIRVVALAAALVAVASLFLYLYARSRVQRVTSAFLRRMGFGTGMEAASIAMEAAGLVGFAALAGAAAALVGARPLVARVDPLPQYLPPAALVVPWSLLAVSFIALVLVAAAAGAVAGALAGRGEVGEALRVA